MVIWNKEYKFPLPNQQGSVSKHIRSNPLKEILEMFWVVVDPIDCISNDISLYIVIS